MKKGNLTFLPIEKMKKNNEKSDEIDKIHFGEFKEFGVDGGEDERGERK